MRSLICSLSCDFSVIKLKCMHSNNDKYYYDIKNGHKSCKKT